MGWLKALAQILSLFFAELEKHRAEAKQIRREDRRASIEETPTNANAELFGASAGRVRIDDDVTKKPVRPDAPDA
jgi:hypothetical protein